MSQTQISHTVGASERTERILVTNNLNQKLLPTHEQIIRKAPEQYQDAIVKLYKDGWTQEALGQMWNVNHGQISRIIGAKERTERLCESHNLKEKLLPGHEELIRRAPEQISHVLRRNDVESVAMTGLRQNDVSALRLGLQLSETDVRTQLIEYHGFLTIAPLPKERAIPLSTLSLLVRWRST